MLGEARDNANMECVSSVVGAISHLIIILNHGTRIEKRGCVESRFTSTIIRRVGPVAKKEAVGKVAF